MCPARAVAAVLAEDAISTSETPLLPTLNVTAAAGDAASAVGLNPAAAPAHVLGVTWPALAPFLLVFAAVSDEYLPLLAGAAAATPLTRVSRAPRSCAAVSPVSDEALAIDAVAVLGPLQLLRPATAAGTSSSPYAILQ